ncbi:unnamed protein product [Auanema sp. JU1783]|nr:unnamed protein product [Auanema sp. JU1783]
MDHVVMISDIAWIPRGVAKEIPDKIKLTNAELKELIQGDVPETTDNDDDSENEKMEEDEDEKPTEGLRGSQPEEVASDQEETIDDKYLKNFDEVDKQEGMKGIAVFADNKDDPYVTNHDNSDDEEEEKDDFVIRPTDNLLAVAKIDKNEYTLEVHVYNEETGDFYCHHDYILEAPPLCIEPIFYDPGNEETSGKGNLVAVGTMDSEIHIWDLDIVNSCSPFLTLGKKPKTKKRSKRDGSAQGHKDAVISLAWNKLMEHVMASGGADKQIVLWDLDECKPAQSISKRNGEVQTIAWHPVESTFLLAGTMKGTVEVIDCREEAGSASAQWSFETQIEKVTWNHFNPFTCFVAGDDGILRYLDMRKPGEVIWEEKAHDGSIGGLVLSTKIRGLLNSFGHDGIMNTYKLHDDGNIEKVHFTALNLGELHSASFNPDAGTIVAVGGSKEDLVRVLDLSKHEKIVESFQ